MFPGKVGGFDFLYAMVDLVLDNFQECKIIPAAPVQAVWCKIMNALSLHIIGVGFQLVKQPSSVRVLFKMCLSKADCRSPHTFNSSLSLFPPPASSLPSLVVCGRLNIGAFLPSPPPSLCCLRLPAD